MFAYRIAGSAEDRILTDVEVRAPAVGDLGTNERRALEYALTEMVNNAIDHSAGTQVRVRVEVGPDRIVLEVDDDGVGALERVRAGRGVADHVEAAAELVDAARDDAAIVAEEPASGTRVVVELRRPLPRSLTDVFAEWTEDYDFIRTRTVVRLFGLGLSFVSRSEARRLLQGLERFRHIVLDFERVPGIGQGSPTRSSGCSRARTRRSRSNR